LDYEDFRDMFRQAMRDAHLLSAPLLPSETLDLRSGNRSYRIFLHHNPGTNQPGLIHVATELKWTWDSILIARFTTTEEDLLTELLGPENAPDNTEPPFLRVDITLHASVPMDGFYPVPSGGSWRKWAAEVETTVRPYFFVYTTNDPEYPPFQSWTGEPEVELHCSPGGQLYLHGVSLSAWQLLRLPRQWDDPDRPRDEDPLPALVEFLERAGEAQEAWGETLEYLLEK
jgi:hypothetical protein